jgi:WD40 repeat protein
MNKGKIFQNFKLLRQPTATTSESNIDTRDIESPHLRPSASQNTIYSAGAPIACLDKSSDGQQAVIAGAKVFKILKIDGSTITEHLDLRDRISSYAPTHDLSAATPEQLNIRAVKWSHGALDSTIVTASGNGRITVYDLNREGLEVGRIREHARQVHKLDISPFRGNHLLSASQDGTVKYFDINSPQYQQGRNAPPTFKFVKDFRCNADAVRDVKWSPTDGVEFACCTDAGVILKWDIRYPSAPKLKLATAHSKPCFSISWHPDGDHIVSGGSDQVCHVWDMSKAADGNHRQKPKYTFSTPAPVSRVSWRPAFWSATAHGKRAAQVIVAYDDSNANQIQTSTVHLWDLARPSMPFKEIEQWDSSPTGLLWNSRDLLWTVDREGHFTQTDVAFVPKVIDRRSLSTFSFSPTGDVLMLLEERQAPRRPRPSITSPEISPNFQHNGSEPILSVSRSDSEEDVVGSFLGPRYPKSHRRRNSGRSTLSMSMTPPSITGISENKVMSLEDAVRVTGTYKPQQVMAIGHAPSAANRAVYQYYTNRYLMRMVEKDSLDSVPTNDRMMSTMESYAKSAEDVGHYRLAQTWRLLSYTMNLLLTRRAEHHRQSRLTVQKPPSKEYQVMEAVLESRPQTGRGEETPRKQPRPQTPLDSAFNKRPRSIIAEDIESTSNVATPLVRPVHDHIVQQTREAMHTPISIENDILNLPDAAHPRAPSPIPVPGAKSSLDRPSSSIEGYDFYGMESFAPALDFVAPPRKMPLRLEYARKNQDSRIEPKRHDSGESFQMFSTSGDSHDGKFMSSSDSDRHSLGNEQSRPLRERVSSWENSSSENSNSRHRPSVDSDAPAHSESSEEHHTPDSRAVDRRAQGITPHRPSSPPLFRLHEASAPKAPILPPTEDRSISPHSFERISVDPNIIEGDFFPWPNDPPFVIKPLDPTILIQRAINFETQTSSLNASAMILLLKPLLPPSSIDKIQANAILRTYHHRLTSMKLFAEAALLRNLCAPTYPSVFATAQESVTIGYYCTDCHKPIENDPLIPGSMWRCPRCQQNIDTCVICSSRDIDSTAQYEKDDVEFETKGWWSCPGCGHGGHSICMQAWHSGPEEGHEGERYSGGCCPLEGCLHPCLPGIWREKKAEEKKIKTAREMDMLISRENSRQGSRGTENRRLQNVRRDGREATQSRAVEGVRVALRVGVGSSGASTLPAASSVASGSGSGGGLERKKSVKLVAPGEEA